AAATRRQRRAILARDPARARAVPLGATTRPLHQRRPSLRTLRPRLPRRNPPLPHLRRRRHTPPHAPRNRNSRRHRPTTNARLTSGAAVGRLVTQLLELLQHALELVLRPGQLPRESHDVAAARNPGVAEREV